jgi:putative PIN family toxin of toxin-antitoxin system
VTRATLDSNVYISAFVFGGKPGRVIEMATEGTIDVAVSNAIVAEVRRVLLTKFGWSVERAAEVVETIETMATPTTAREVLDVVERDPDDNRVLECATAAQSEFVVTGDNDLLALGSFRGIAIVTVASFLRKFDVQGL